MERFTGSKVVGNHIKLSSRLRPSKKTYIVGLDGSELSFRSVQTAAQLMDDSLPSSTGQPQERLVGYMRKFLEPKQYPLPGVMERRLELLRDLPFRSVLTTNFNPLISGITPFDARRV